MPNFSLTVKAGNMAFTPTSASVIYRINQAAVATITLNFANHKELIASQNNLMLNEEMKITLNGKPLFTGRITRQVCQLPAGSFSIFLEAHHDLQKLKANYRSELYANQTDAQILKKIMGNHNIKLNSLDGMQLRHEQMVQVNCSDWRFIRTRLNACGVLLVSTPDGVKVLAPSLPTADITLAPPTRLLSATVERRNSQLAAGIEMSSWNIDQQNMRTPARAVKVDTGTENYDANVLKTLNPTFWQQGLSRALQDEELRAAANGHRLMNRLAALSASLEIEGNVVPEPGKGIKIENFGALDGTAFITGIKHNFAISSDRDKRWTTSIEVGSNLLIGMDSELVPAAPGLHIGVVDENPQGPDDYHALKIQLPAFQLGNVTLNARLGVPFASAESGFNFYPRKGDEVVVAFIEDDPRFPVILGAMHNPVNKAPKSALDQGIGMVLKTDTLTQRLMLHPTEGLLLEEEKGAAKSRLTLKEGAATLVVSESVTIDANNLDLKANQKSTFVGNSGVEIKGSTVQLKQ